MDNSKETLKDNFVDDSKLGPEDGKDHSHDRVYGEEVSMPGCDVSLSFTRMLACF